jgi:hypothetical protein
MLRLPGSPMTRHPDRPRTLDLALAPTAADQRHRTRGPGGEIARDLGSNPGTLRNCSAGYLRFAHRIDRPTLSDSGAYLASPDGSSASPGPPFEAATGASVRSWESTTDPRFGAPENQERTTAVAPAEGSAGTGGNRSDGGIQQPTPRPRRRRASALLSGSNVWQRHGSIPPDSVEVPPHPGTTA